MAHMEPPADQRFSILVDTVNAASDIVDASAKDRDRAWDEAHEFVWLSLLRAARALRTGATLALLTVCTVSWWRRHCVGLLCQNL